MSNRDKSLKSAMMILGQLSQNKSLSESELDAIRFLATACMDESTKGEEIVRAIRSLRKLGIALVQYNDLGQPTLVCRVLNAWYITGL